MWKRGNTCIRTRTVLYTKNGGINDSHGEQTQLSTKQTTDNVSVVYQDLLQDQPHFSKVQYNLERNDVDGYG